jgi:hypothetical protein
MNIEQFEDTLRQILRKEPFQPFEVEMIDGRILHVEQKVAFGGGAAVYITPSLEIVEFACEDVQAIRSAVPGAIA